MKFKELKIHSDTLYTEQPKASILKKKISRINKLDSKFVG